MRIQIENEAVEQISKDTPLEIHQKTSNSNISLSMENKNDYANQNINSKFNTKHFNKNENNIVNKTVKNNTLPAVRLSSLIILGYFLFSKNFFASTLFSKIPKLAVGILYS